jgi:fumarylpyruvate hydrolase
VFEPWLPPTVPVAGRSERFGVRRVLCVGRNYDAHTREMGGDPQLDPPCFFAKPTDSVVPGGGEVRYPKATAELHHEIELVVAIGHELDDAPAARSLEAVYGYAVGLDMTRRDLQREAKARRWPWMLAKGFDGAAPVGAIARAADIGHPRSGAVRLWVDGALRQEGDLAQLVLSVPELLAALSQVLTLRPGDLVFTGTPSGVGPVAPGATLHGEIAGVGALDVRVLPRELPPATASDRTAR